MRTIALTFLLLTLGACGEIAKVGLDTGFDQDDISALRAQVDELQQTLDLAVQAMGVLQEQNVELIQQLNVCQQFAGGGQ